jgi:hypothetical protein
MRPAYAVRAAFVSEFKVNKCKNCDCKILYFYGRFSVGLLGYDAVL